MRHDWNISKTQSFLRPKPKIKEVLIEHDGPILAVLEGEGKVSLLGLAVDREDKWSRWLEAPISKLELEGLKLGGAAVRDVFTSAAELCIVDYDRRHIPRSAARVTLDMVPEAVLPARRAVLPMGAQIAARVREGFTEFHLAGEGVAENAVPFPKLSAFMAKAQAVWSAFAESLSVTINPLLATSLAPGGSMVITVCPDTDPSFDKVAALYRQLTLSAGDGETLEKILVEKPREVSRAYADYLKLLHLHRLEVLTESPEGAAYIGPRTAGIARESVREAIKEIDPTPEVSDLRTDGYFEGFLPSRSRFEFYDLQTSTTYQGTIDRALKAQIRADQRFGLTLGKGLQKYAVRIRMVQKGDSPRKYTLVDYSQIGEEPTK